MFCPTDQRPDPAAFHMPRPVPGLPGDLAASSYVACAGTSIDPTTGDSDGGFGRNVSWRLADIKDGAFATLMLGERSRALSDATWTGVAPDGLIPGVQHCTAPGRPVRSCGPVWGMVLGVTDLPGNPPGTTIGLNRAQADRAAFSSLHGDGVNFVLFDGSVRSFRDTINPKVFRSLATRDGGDNGDRFNDY